MMAAFLCCPSVTAREATLRCRGEVAQLVEHTAENRGVAGSIPALATPPRQTTSPAPARGTRRPGKPPRVARRPAARVEGVAEPVRQEARGHGEDGDRQARQEDEPEAAERDPLEGDVAPGRRGRLGAEAEDGQERLAEDHRRELEEDGDDDDPERVRDDVAPCDRRATRTQCLRGADVLLPLPQDDLASDQPRRDHPVDDGEREDDRLDVLRLQPDEDEDDDADGQPRDGEEPVQEPHHRRVHPAAEDPRRGAVPDAEHEDDAERRPGDQERRPAAGGEPREDVAAVLIRSEPVIAARRLPDGGEVGGVRVVRRDERHQDAEGDDGEQDRRAEHPRPVPEERRRRPPGAAHAFSSSSRGSRIAMRTSATRFTARTSTVSATVRPRIIG